MKIKLITIIVLSCLILASFAVGEVKKQSSTTKIVEQSKPDNDQITITRPMTGETIKWQVISGGGNSGTSTNYELSSTIGQTATGKGSSTNYNLGHGYWQVFEEE